MDTTLFFQWAFLISLLALLAYTMHVIKKEKFDYLEKAVNLDFHRYPLLIPSWWSEMKDGDTKHLGFKRTDTYYDWRASYDLLEKQDLFEQPIEEVFRDLIEAQQIQFDANEAIIHLPSEFKTTQAITSGDYDIVRVEGMGTEKQTERIYLDAFLIRNNKDKNHLYGQSHSSVLNGMLEGPYFEQVLQNLVKSL